MTPSSPSLRAIYDRISKYTSVYIAKIFIYIIPSKTNIAVEDM